jgi:hypothetical protein
MKTNDRESVDDLYVDTIYSEVIHARKSSALQTIHPRLYRLLSLESTTRRCIYCKRSVEGDLTIELPETSNEADRLFNADEMV